MRERPQPYELYRHFKGNTYQILCIATHSETGEEMVVYQALYGDYKVYVRPLTMFMEPVDRTKYPDAAQQYRFERIVADRSVFEPGRAVGDVSFTAEVPKQRSASGAPGVSVISEVPVKPVTSRDDTSNSNSDVFFDDMDEPETCVLDPGVERFLDSETYEQKLEILRSMRDRIDDEMIDIMSTVIDIEIPEGRIERRYDRFMDALQTRARYEAHRLR